MLEQPLPAVDEIPNDTVKAWFEVPEDQPLQFTLTRADIDQAYNAYTELARSVLALQKSSVSADLAERNINLRFSQLDMISGLNSARAVVRRIMEATLQARRGVDG